jgi:hypothetical protein
MPVPGHMLSVEGPHIEVLDAVLPVDVVQGQHLGTAPGPAGGRHSGRNRAMALEQLGPSLSGQRSEAQKVGYLDAGQGPIHVRGHSAIVAPMLQVRFATMPKRATCGK